MQRSSATDYVSSTNIYLPGSMGQIQVDPISVNPATSVQFVESDISGAEFGYKVVV